MADWPTASAREGDWQVVRPVLLDAWAALAAPMDSYPAGSAAPKEAAPKEGALKEAAPKEAAPKEAAPKEADEFLARDGRVWTRLG